MHTSVSPLRCLIAVTGLALGLLVSMAAPSAQAVPPICTIDCPPPTFVTYHSAITLTPPALGSVHGSNDADSRTIDCSASDGSCTITDSQISDTGRPSDGWPNWTFSYTGSTGYAVTWSGACSGSGSCVVTDDSTSKSISAASYDVAAPLVSIVAPDRVGRATRLTGTASDNSGTVSIERWYVCDPNGNACVLKSLGPSNVTFQLSGEPAGEYVVRFVAQDPSGNLAYSQKVVTLITQLSMTSSDLPAFTEHPSFTFSSDDEAFSTSSCRSYLTGATVPAWGACTTKNSYAPTVADGNWTLQAQELDDVGNDVVVTKTTTVDTSAPIVTITRGPTEAGTVRTPTMGLNFDATDANLQSVTCALDNAAATPCVTGKTLSGYADGAHTLTVTATDKLDHATTVVRHFSVVVPTTLTGHPVSNTYGRAPKLTVSVSPAAATGTVTFTSNGRQLCKAKISNASASCAAPATLVSGTHAVTASYHGSYATSSTKFTLTTRKLATAIHASTVKTIKRGSRLTVRASRLPAAATGIVTVANGSTKLCSTKVRDGSARCSFTVNLAKGTRLLTVSYGGATNYAASKQTIKIEIL